eukprot:7381028-Karenia_brevis.AAC.1
MAHAIMIKNWKARGNPRTHHHPKELGGCGQREVGGTLGEVEAVVLASTTGYLDAPIQEICK